MAAIPHDMTHHDLELIGKQLGPYQVLLQVRTTHTNTVYKAFDTRLGRNVALQVILPGRPRPEGLLARLQEYARILARLSHPNIGVLLDCEQYDDLICLVYDFVPRGVLRRRFNDNLTWEQAVRLMIPVTQALAYAHRQGVVHAYLRPSSILTNESGTPVLFDFGVEALIAQEMLATLPGGWVGDDVACYMAPEQALGKPFDHRADIYSVGMLFYELMTGRRAYQGETGLFEIVQQYARPAISLKKDIRDLPAIGEAILHKCLEANPERRFSDIQHLNGLLARIALGQPVSRQLVNNPNWRPRRPLPAWAWGTGLLAVLALAATFSLPRLLPPLSPTPPLVTPVVSGEAATASPLTITPNGLATATPGAATPTPRATSTSSSHGADAAPAATATRAPVVFQDLPVLFNTPIPSAGAVPITAVNANRMLNLSRFGIGKLHDLAWSKDGSRVGLATATGVYILDSQNYQMQSFINTSGVVSCLAFSPDGSLVATGAPHGLVQLWEVASGRELASLSGHSQVVRRVLFSPNGDLLASASDDRTTRLWDVPTRQLFRVLEGPGAHVQAVTGLAFSPDSKLLATTSLDFNLKLWGTHDGLLIRSMTHGAALYNAVFTPDGKSILTAGGESSINVWDTESGQRQKPLASLRFPVNGLEISPDGQYIAVSDKTGQVMVWDAQGKELWRSRNEGLPRLQDASIDMTHQIVFSADSRVLASGIWDDTVRFWYTNSGAEAAIINTFSDFVEKIAISDDSRYLAAQVINKTVKVWDLPRGKLLYSLPGTLIDGRVFSYDNRYLALKTDPSMLRLYDLTRGSEYLSFSGHASLEAVSFSKDGAYLATGARSELHLWSLRSGQELITNNIDDLGGCWTAKTVEGKILTFRTRFMFIDFADAGNTALCRVDRVGWMRDMVYQKDGTLAAAGGASKLEIWNYRETEKSRIDSSRVNMAGLYGVQVEKIAIAPGGSVVAAAIDDLSIRVWNAKTGAHILTLTGHESTIRALEFTPDGKYLISTSNDGTIRIWGLY